MIYLVTGYMRSGTSMMMQCLVAGGLDPVYDPRREHMNETYGDEHYKPNAKGFYEPSYMEYRKFGFPKMYDGKLMKILRGGVPTLAVADYLVILMRRDPEEIRQSYEAFFGGSADMVILNNYEERLANSEEMIRNRRDMSLTCLDYRSVVDDPRPAFETLHGNGWPIDVDAAAAEVDPTQCRFRLEQLEVGI